jgi:hypothetical protein
VVENNLIIVDVLLKVNIKKNGNPPQTILSGKV